MHKSYPNFAILSVLYLLCFWIVIGNSTYENNVLNVVNYSPIVVIIMNIDIMK